MKHLRSILPCLTIVLLLVQCSLPTAEESPTTRPNILFIMTDDHAKNAMSIYSDRLLETPNLDRIGQEGITFNRSYVTNSICGPSRAVFLTGQYSHINGFRHNYDTFDSARMTYPKILQANGYYTAVVGKWHLKSVPAGFDYWNVLIDQGHYYNPTLVEMGDTAQYPGYATTVVTDLAIETLEQRIPSDQPFCLLVQHKAPHRNWMPDTSYLALGEKEYPIPDNLFDEYNNRQAAAEQDLSIDRMFMSGDMKLPPDRVVETGTGGGPEGFDAVRNWRNLYGRFNDDQRAAWDAYYNPVAEDYYSRNPTGRELLIWKYQRYINDYVKTVMSVDDNVGRLLTYLEEKGQLDNTLIVYTSDQGFYLGEHGWYDKRFMYEESFGMPLVMRYPPLIEPGTVSDQLVLNLDYAPTVMELAGIDTNEPWQGRSLLPLMKGEEVANWREGIYYHYFEYPFGWHSVKRHYGVRTDRYKLIHFYNDIDQWELYDLDNDPDEMHNIYDTADPELIVELKTQLQDLQEQYGDEAWDGEM